MYERGICLKFVHIADVHFDMPFTSARYSKKIIIISTVHTIPLQHPKPSDIGQQVNKAYSHSPKPIIARDLHIFQKKKRKNLELRDKMYYLCRTKAKRPIRLSVRT